MFSASWLGSRPGVACSSSLGAMASDNKEGYYYVQECPMAHDCTTKSFKHAGVWGHSVESCKARLLHHLVMSSHHKLEKVDAEGLAELAEYEFHKEEPQPKRPKTLPIGAPAPAHPIGAPAPPLSGMPTSSSSGLVPLPVAQRSSLIYMRVGEFQSAIDCTSRALHAAQQAHRLSLAASRAFADEVAALESVKTNLEAIKATAEMQVSPAMRGGP